MSNVGVVNDLAVHDIDLIRWLVHRFRHREKSLSNAVAEREDIALLQFRARVLARMEHINTNWSTLPCCAQRDQNSQQIHHGRSLACQVTECFGFQPDGSYSMRHLSVGERAVARQPAGLHQRDPAGAAGCDRREGVASSEIAIRCLEGSAMVERSPATPSTPAGDRLIVLPLALTDLLRSRSL